MTYCVPVVMHSLAHGKNQPMIFIPGMFGKADYYLSFLQPFETDFAVVTYDQVGAAPNRFSVSLATAALESLVTGSEEKVVLMAHSAGAAPALSVALRYPEKVSCVALINPFAGRLCLPSPLKAFMYYVVAPRLEGSHPINSYAHSLSDRNFTVVDMVANAASLLSTQTQKHKYPMPVCYAVADGDEVLGTLGDMQRYKRLRRKLASFLPGSVDLSPTIEGLGLSHCLNGEYGGSRTFLDRPGTLVEALQSFLKNARS